MSALPALLDSLIDYAGLFPPAKLPMADAVRNHAAYLHGRQAAMLGRFILPAARIAEFETAYATLTASEKSGWRLSLLGSTDASADAAAIVGFNQHHPRARIDAVEAKASSPAEITALSAAFPASLELWIEIPSNADPSTLLAAIKSAGRGAKIRTGGVTADAFPPAADITRFLAACHTTGVVCKATAGLHHPLRADYRLTYEPGSACGPMFGFLNVFLAAALIDSGGSTSDATALLADTHVANFSCTPDALAWRGHPFSIAQLTAARRALCRSFGSCSFTEPIEGLQELHWL